MSHTKREPIPTAFIVALLPCLCASVFAADLGWQDTPMIPGQRWHVHDFARPMAPVVQAGESFTLGARPPADAIVLFNGQDLSQWAGNRGAARWKVENGYFEAARGSGDIHTTNEFGDFQLHLEWAEPAVVAGDSQGRGNSGVFLHGRFEVQVLDSYDNPTYADGQCGAIYGQWPPQVNASKKPGEWQSYDIIFEAPHWDQTNKLVQPAFVTVIQNGVVLHNHREILGATGHRILPKYTPYPSRGPLVLQDHGNPVRFRNIWIRNLVQDDKR